MMAKEKAPAFQFYPKEFLSDGNVSSMSLQERGAYITLLCYCWNDGSLPTEVDRLSNMCGTPIKAFEKFWPAVRLCFNEVEGRLQHPRLDRERLKQAQHRQRASDKGSRGAESRWHRHSPGNGTGITQASPNHGSPISDLRSPIRSEQRTLTPSARAPELAPPDSEIATRASALLELYGELYAKHRKGAKHLQIGSNLDWTQACDLCRTWDDARLSKLIDIFLTTDDEWISSTARTFRIFVTRATWCDDRLAQWEAKRKSS